MAGNCDFWWTIFESLPTTLDVASRTQVGTEDERSFADLLRELRIGRPGLAIIFRAPYGIPVSKEESHRFDTVTRVNV